MEININDLRILCKGDKFRWSIHSLKRMRERQITVDDYKACIMNGEIIEQYPNDRPLPSCLISGYSVDNKHLHDVLGTDNAFIYAITAYYPSVSEWESDFKTRKEH